MTRTNYYYINQSEGYYAKILALKLSVTLILDWIIRDDLSIYQIPQITV